MKKLIAATLALLFLIALIAPITSPAVAEPPEPQLPDMQVLAEFAPLADEPAQWHHDEMHTAAAWARSRGAGVLIAVIDTGIDITHPDFAGRISPLSYNAFTGEVGIEHVADDYGHGTHIAGIAAGAIAGKNGGVAPESQLLIIKANKPGEGNFDSGSFMRGLSYAVENGADIINLSIGRPFVSAEGVSGYNSEEHLAVQQAIDSGATIVAATGNHRDSNAVYPAAYPGVIAVSSTRRDYAFARTFSNYGSQVAVAAPGYEIIAPKNGGGYTAMSGTSMSASAVAGTAALIKSLNPEYTPEQIRAVLRVTATRVTAGNIAVSEYHGSGVVNAANAVAAAHGLPAEPAQVRIRGDVGGNGIADLQDSLALLMQAAGNGEPPGEPELRFFDIDGDGKIGISDALEVLRYAIGAIEEL